MKIKHVTIMFSINGKLIPMEIREDGILEENKMLVKNVIEETKEFLDKQLKELK